MIIAILRFNKKDSNHIGTTKISLIELEKKIIHLKIIEEAKNFLNKNNTKEYYAIASEKDLEG